MNASSWKKAADFVAQQAATTTDSQQLDTLPLSQLSVDDCSPPQVNYGIDHPLVSSMPQASLTSDNITTAAEHDRQIIPGIPNQLYPSITNNNDVHPHTPGEHKSIADSINDELNKYLEQAAEKRKLEHNYFESGGQTINNLPDIQEVFHHQDTDHSPLKEKTLRKTPESLEEDTGSIPEDDNAQQDDCLSTISEESHQEEEDPADQDTLTFNDDIDQTDNEHFNTAVDIASDNSHITMGKPMFTPFISDLVHVPTEKVGCLQVTQTLQQFLDEYPPKT